MTLNRHMSIFYPMLISDYKAIHLSFKAGAGGCHQENSIWMGLEKQLQVNSYFNILLILTSPHS